MASIKSLAKDTAYYGLSSIVGRFLNWCLVPLYTRMFPEAEYGIVTYIYSIVALVLIMLIYGMETGFFRFTNHDRYDNPMEVYTTTLISLGASSTIFFIAVLAFLQPISDALGCGSSPSYISIMAAAVAIDAFTAIPFSYLRYRHQALRFAVLKSINIALNIGFALFFILICPWLWEEAPGTIAWFYDPDFGIGYIFLANLIASAAMPLLLLPKLRGFKWQFNGKLWREMLKYSFPLLILGIAGIMNQNLDKILLPELIAGKSEAWAQLGIYGANYKIAIIMVMFLQAFRFAYEPFIFAQNRQRGGDKNQAFRDAMKYFVIFAMTIFLGVMFYLDIIKYFIPPKYFSGLKVVPIVMIAEFFFGVFFNLSLWYKLTDRTIWGTWFSLLGFAVTLTLNILLVPRMGYMGCAYAALGCYGTMMLASYFVGRAKHPIGYDVPSLLIYFFSALALYAVSIFVTTSMEWLNMIIRTLLLVLYVIFVCKREKINPASLTKQILKRKSNSVAI